MLYDLIDIFIAGIQEEFEDTKKVVRIRKSKKDIQHDGQKQKDKRTNNDPQNITHKRSSNTNPTKNRGLTPVFRKDKQFLLH